MKPFLAFAFLMFAATLHAGDKPYDETADAKTDIQKALIKASEEHKSVLVVFGANWCPDCRVLDVALKQGPSADLVSKEYEVVKVDLGRYDHNVDLAKSYGVMLDRGIPTVALLSAKGEVLYTTKDKELSDARHLGDDGIYQFFKKTIAEHPPKA